MNFSEPKWLTNIPAKYTSTNSKYPGHFTSISFSPDGTHVAYACDKGRRCAIVLLELSTGRGDWVAGQYNERDDTYWHLQFTPDSESLVCVLAEDDEAIHDLVVIDIATRRQRRLTEDAQVSSHDLSPDGKSVLFTGGHEGRHGVYRIDLAGEQVVRVIDDIAQTRYRNVRYSPDGTRIAVLASACDSARGDDGEEIPPQLFVMHADGSGLRQLTDIPDGVGDLRWHPASARIAFAARTVLRPGADPRSWVHRQRIGVVNIDGSGLRPVTDSRCVVRLGCYRPGDGRYMCYGAACDSQNQEGKRTMKVCLVDEATCDTRSVTDGDFRETDPIFSPDSRRLMFVSERTSESGVTGEHLYSVEITE